MNINEMLSEAIENYNRGNLKVAEHTCQRILKKEKNHVDALYLLSAVYFDQDKLSKADKLIKKAISRDNQQARYHNIQALILIKQKK